MEDKDTKFPVGGETMARETDPDTSHQAAEEFRSTGKLGKAQKEILEAIHKWPGETMRELTESRMGVDGQTYRTRCSELRRAGFVFYGKKRACRLTGKICITLWPINYHGELQNG